MASERSRDSHERPLNSWKSIANHLQRDVRTVQRWERDEGLPVYRHEHKKQATVYAYASEIDAWRNDRMRPEASPPERPSSRTGRTWLVLAATAVSLAVFAWWYLATQPVAPDSPNRQFLVVLPFEDLGETSLGSMADGLNDEIGSRLASAEPDKLAVIARTSAMSLKGRPVSISEIRDQLNIDFAIEGTIRSDGNIVRVSAQLVDARTQARLWSDTFDYPLGQALATQQAAASDILRPMSGILGISETALVRTRTLQADAYDNALLGWHYFDQFRGDTLATAIGYFESAIEYDPTYVDAHAGIALTHAAQAFFKTAPGADSYQRAREHASIALNLDPQNGEALAVLGWIKFAYSWRWDESGRDLRRAVEVAPNSPWTNWLLANYLSAMNRSEQAVQVIDEAMRLDPVSPYVLVARSYILNNAGRYRDAIDHMRESTDRLGSAVVYGYLIEAHEELSDLNAAIETGESLGINGIDDLRRAYTNEGDIGYWRVLLAQQAAARLRFPDLFDFRHFVVAARAGERELALTLLEEGYRRRESAMIFLPAYRLESLHSDPRFQALWHRMDFPVDTPR